MFRTKKSYLVRAVFHWKVIICGLLFFNLSLAIMDAQAQGKPKVVQFSGVVATGDSLFGVPGVTVFVPKAGRGTITNTYGYFSMPVLAGDSVVIRALGYKHLTVKIPRNYNKDSYSVVLELSEDPTVLPEVRVWPYPTEREFKQAFLKLKVPERSLTGPERSLNEKVMAMIFANTDVGPAANFQNTMSMQQLQRDRQTGVAPNPYTNNPVLNPFAWMKFIEQIKNGDLKKK
ncbi:carboxypeptidase-like regulatory domain-containing protein [Adhaeribacter aquaticus]|uniref:carboxypeptidase-like regulatory domain-containing protein n=1 Tax=Adhaeribacter aquaticus TaxID=299567 RepID=UPI00041DA0ED|nr:carboxypeptidase-like regulatory domain-containing protein [Adhaeribacter aquaticus]